MLMFSFFFTRLGFLSFFLCAAVISCAPARPPVPPGVIPQAKPLSITDEQYGHQVFQELADHYEQDYNNPRAIEVQNIVDRLTRAAGAGSDPWHVYIFKDASVKNAAATRGNHVFIWTGLLDSTKNEAELATILAHEISHVLAGHTDPDPNEEAKKLLIAIGSMAAGIAVSAATHSPSWSQNIGDATSQVTSELGNSLLIYPYSRDKEYEADQIGLFLMADAKYDPQAALDFWERAENDPELAGTMGFLSTHPPAKDRLERLKQLFPQAEARYRGVAAPQNALPGSPASGRGPAAVSQLNPQPPAVKSSPAPSASAAQSAGNPSNASTTTTDSFSFGPASAAKPEIFAPLPAETEKSAYPRWVVSSSSAFLYAEARQNSRKLGELKRGAILRVRSARGGWLGTVSPDSGYVLRRDCRPLD
jgi:hypothetical protein